MNNERCVRRNSWKKVTNGLGSKLIAMKDSFYFEAKMAFKSGSGLIKVGRWYVAKKAVQKKKVAEALHKALGKGKSVEKIGQILGTSPKLIRVKTFSQLGKLYARCVKGSMKNGVGIVKSGKFLTKIATRMTKVGAGGLKSLGKAAAAFVGKLFEKVMIAVTIWGIVSDIQDMVDYFDSGQIALGVFATVSLLAGCFTLVATVTSMVAAAAGAAFAAGSTVGTFLTGPFAPLVGAAVAAIAALGALIVSLLDPPPGNQDFGDQYCCFTYRTWIDHKYLQGLDNPTSRYRDKSDSGCHDYADLLQVLPGLPGPNRTMGSSRASEGQLALEDRSVRHNLTEALPWM